MSNKLERDEVLFEVRDGTEYATLHADAFRDAMRIRDELQAERARLTRERDEALQGWEDMTHHYERVRLERTGLQTEIGRLQALVNTLLHKP